jgi:hypothetical protein
LVVPDEQIAGDEMLRLWRSEGSSAEGGVPDPSVAYIAQAHIDSIDEDEAAAS